MAKRLALLALIACSTALSNAAEVPQRVRVDFEEWATRSLHQVSDATLERSNEDLRPMRAMIGDARVVALSEGVHAGTEPLVFRNRLFEYLVEELGFTAIVIESGLTESRLLNDYIAGGGGELGEILKQGFSWGHETFRQNRELVRWMREYNARLPRGAAKLQIFGMDVPGSPGNLDAARGPATALETSLDYLRSVDASAAAHLQPRFDPFLPALRNTNGYGALNQAHRDALTAAIADLISLMQRRRFDYIGKSSEHDYEWSERNAIAARQTDTWFRQMPLDWKVADGFEWTQEGMNVRDRAMADNLEWIVDRLEARSRVLVFASVPHISSASLTLPESRSRPVVPFGAYAKARYGAGMVSIFNAVVGGEIHYCSSSPRRVMPLKPAPPSSIESLFASTGTRRYILDLRTAPPIVAAWLKEPQDYWNGFARRQLALVPAFDIAFFVTPVTSDCFAEEAMR